MHKAGLTDDQLVELTKQLTARGKMVEAGFAGLRLACMAKDAPQIQIDEMRMAFFAGAAHVYQSLMCMLDPGEDPTTADLTRMEQFHDELQAFIRDFEIRHVPTQGQA